MSVAARAGRKASVAPPFPSARDLNPQFILLTNDDSVSPTVHKLLRSVTDGRRSATGGCPAVATMFAVGRLDYGQSEPLKQPRRPAAAGAGQRATAGMAACRHPHLLTPAPPSSRPPAPSCRRPQSALW